MIKIHILEGHFNNNTTVIVGEFCRNGCLSFHMSSALHVFDNNNVPKKHQTQIMNLFVKNITTKTKTFDLSPLETCKTADGKIAIKLLLSYYNIPQVIDYLFNNKIADYVIAGMCYYSFEQKMLLAQHESGLVRAEVALYGLAHNINTITDMLIQDPNVYIREQIAMHGEKEHLDILVYDVSPSVRIGVAKRGFKEHLDILVNDGDEFVRQAVAQYGDQDHLVMLEHDRDWWVRQTVILNIR